MAGTVIENLITQLSFDFDEDKLEKFDDLIEDAAKGLAVVVASATAAAVAVFAFTKSIAESNDALGKFAQRTGISVEALQELGFVAELNGGSIDSMNSSLENLSRIASEAARGMGPGIEAFGILGVSVTDANGQLKDADDLLMDVADSIARLDSQAERLEFAQKLGIGGDLLLAIQQGSEAIKKQREEARELGFVIDQNAAAAAADFNDELLRLSKMALATANVIGTRLMKEITPLIKAIVTWRKENSKLLKQNLTFFVDKLSKAIRIVVNVSRRVMSGIQAIVSAMGGWKVAILATTALLLAMNASALLMPILAVAAGIGILLILEDIITFAQGGDSAIGNLAERFPILDSFLVNTLSLLAMSAEGWRLIFTEGDEALEGLMFMIRDLAKEFPIIAKGVDLIVGIIGVLTDKFLQLFSMVVEGWGLILTQGDEAFDGLILMVNDFIDSFSPLRAVIESIKLVILSIPDAFGLMVDEGKDAINKLTEIIMSFKDSVKSFILDPLDSVTDLINKIPGINIGGDVSGEGPETQENVNTIIENIAPELEKIIIPIEKSIEPIKEIISPVVNAIPPIIEISEPMINNVLPSIGESQNRETNISRLSTSNTLTQNTNNFNNDNRVSSKPNITIEINGGDLDAVKRTVNDVMNKQYSAAQTILDSQVEF